jgi:hypothetical protein
MGSISFMGCQFILSIADGHYASKMLQMTTTAKTLRKSFDPQSNPGG